MSRAGAVVAAAGTGERLGDHGPKALVSAGGATLLELALGVLRDVAAIEAIVVVHPPGVGDEFRAIVGPAVDLVAGGASRAESVRAGLAVLETELVAVHDAARPLVPVEVVERTLRAVRGDVIAAAPGLPVADTLKRVRDGEVRETIDRRDLWGAQTPQVVRRDVLEVAYAQAADGATDELGLVEAARSRGLVEGRIELVRGHPRGMKVTYPGDIQVVAALVAHDEARR